MLRAIAVLLFLTVPSFAAFADAASNFAEKAYKDMEAQIQKEWRQALEMTQKEQDRRTKAGEAPVSEQAKRDGIAGIKMLFYNRAVIHAVCAEEAFRDNNSAQDASSYLSKCVNERLAELSKFMKVVQYYPTISKTRNALCEMRSRDYKNELRFAPYEFLRSAGSELYLFDFKKFSECFFSEPN